MIGLSSPTLIWNCTQHYRNGKMFRDDYTRLTRCKTVKQLYETDQSKKAGHHIGKYKVKVLDLKEQLRAPSNVFRYGRITSIEHEGKDDTYELETYSGFKIRTTLLQRLLCFEFKYKNPNNMRFLEIGYLTTGHRVAVDPNLWGGGLRWDEIKDIKKVKPGIIYSLKLDDQFNNCVANGFVIGL